MRSHSFATPHLDEIEKLGIEVVREPGLDRDQALDATVLFAP
jgi:hypothetical protein